jgi:hypothetical protein
MSDLSDSPWFGIGVLLLIVVAVTLWIWSPWISEEERCMNAAASYVEMYGVAVSKKEPQVASRTLDRARDAGVYLPRRCLDLAVTCRTRYDWRTIPACLGDDFDKRCVENSTTPYGSFCLR